jgi:hypothetical protein
LPGLAQLEAQFQALDDLDLFCADSEDELLWIDEESGAVELHPMIAPFWGRFLDNCKCWAFTGSSG